MIEVPSGLTIQASAAAIRAGKLVAFPTETVYGLGADATNPEAVARIFAVKGRPRFDPLIVHIGSIESARTIAAIWPDEAERLARTFWPGPLTLVLPKNAAIIPDIVTAGLDSVALRMPDHSVALSLIRAAGKPIAAPSANRFGHVSPTCAEHVEESFGNDARIAHILDGGPCRVGVESTVVSMVDPSRPIILRPGGVSRETVEAALGAPVATVDTDSGATSAAAEIGKSSPGMLSKHYATRKPLFLAGSELPKGMARARMARIVFGPLAVVAEESDIAGFGFVRTLSERADQVEAAANLFRIMREVDAMPEVEAIVADRVPEEGLGIAINDRLRRASTR